MTRYVRLGAAAALIVGFALLARPGSAGDADKGFKPFLPAAAYKELVARAAKNIEEALAEKGEEAVQKAQFNAAMIASYTFSTKDGGTPEELAAVRDAAAKIAKLVKQKGKAEEVKRLVASIPTLKGGAAGKVTVADVKAFVDERVHIMDHYRVKAKGGDGMHPSLQSNIRLKGALNGIEEKIRVLGNKPIANPEKESAELVLLGYRAAVHAGLTYHFAPEKKTKKKDPEDWRRFAVEMRDAGIALAEAAAKKDAEKIFKAGEALNGSCNRCHSEFR